MQLGAHELPPEGLQHNEVFCHPPLQSTQPRSPIVQGTRERYHEWKDNHHSGIPGSSGVTQVATKKPQAQHWATKQASTNRATSLAATAHRADGGPAALSEAVQQKDWPRSWALLRDGADPLEPGVGGNTALHWAAAHGTWEILEAMLGSSKHASPRNRHGLTPLHNAAQCASTGGPDVYGNEETAHMRCTSSLQARASRSYRDLGHGGEAAAMDHLRCLNSLLRHRASPYHEASDGMSALQMAQNSTSRRSEQAAALLLKWESRRAIQSRPRSAAK